jgi:hypothetical protein
MAGLVPAIHGLRSRKKDVDARHKATAVRFRLFSVQANPFPPIIEPLHVMAGLVPAIHALQSGKKRRGCPAQGRARRLRSVDDMHSYNRIRSTGQPWHKAGHDDCKVCAKAGTTT